MSARPSGFDASQWNEIWQATLRLLSQTLAPAQLDNWIRPLQLRTMTQSDQRLDVNLEASNEFTANWVLTHHRNDLEGAFMQVVGSHCKIQISVGEPLKDTRLDQFEASVENSSAQGAMHLSLPDELPAPRPPKRDRADPPTPAATPVVNPETPLRSSYDQPDLRYTFEGFVVGASNQFAHASAIAVADQPARQYNPLFLYSPPGLGKTHLLHAIGNHVMTQQTGARVAYLSAEKFVNELIDSLQHRRMSQFRIKYRDSFDLILIDDIQFIAGKTTSEEEFFHTFNALHSSKRQIVLSSDRPPKEIEGLEERIRTRFEWGLIADITPPEIETRIAILKAKAERDDIYLPDDVATFLASYIKSNVRELEGLLIRLQAHASLSGAEISLEMAKQELKMAIPVQGVAYTVEAIQNAVAKHYRLKVAELKNPTRARTIALPRQVAIYLIRKYTQLGYREIGQFFGGKDHTTILHACQKVEEAMSGESELREAVETIQNML